MSANLIARWAALSLAGASLSAFAAHEPWHEPDPEAAAYDRYVVVAPRLTRPAQEYFLIEDVKEALALDPSVRPAKIDVDYERGAVTLSGQVRSDAEAERAARAARSAAGTVNVHNYLRPGFMN